MKRTIMKVFSILLVLIISVSCVFCTVLASETPETGGGTTETGETTEPEKVSFGEWLGANKELIITFGILIIAAGILAAAGKRMAGFIITVAGAIFILGFFGVPVKDVATDFKESATAYAQANPTDTSPWGKLLDDLIAVGEDFGDIFKSIKENVQKFFSGESFDFDFGRFFRPSESEPVDDSGGEDSGGGGSGEPVPAEGP